MPKEKSEIVGILRTAVVRSKFSGGQKHYTIDLKLETSEVSDVMFKLENNISKVVGITIDAKQLKLGDKF